MFHDGQRRPVEYFPDGLTAVVTDALRPGGNSSEDLRGKIAAADLIQTARQNRSPVNQPALAHERGSNPDTQRKKGVFPIRARESADVPVRLALLLRHQPQAIFYLPKRRGNEQLSGTLIAEFLTESQLPRPHGRIVSMCDARESNFRNRARADKTKTRASEQLPQVRVLDIGTSAQPKFVAEQIAQVHRRAPLEDALLRRRERGERGGRGAVR